MKDFMDFEEHKAMKEKRSKKMSSKTRKKEGLEYEDIIDTVEIKKTKIIKNKSVKPKISGLKDDSFKNNYKNFQYDYEEDFYDPGYGY